MSQSPAADTPVDPSDAPASTGDDAIDQVLQRTAALADREVAEHPAVFEDVHRVLRDSLHGTRVTPAEGRRE